MRRPLVFLLLAACPQKSVPNCPQTYRELTPGTKEAGGDCQCPLGVGTGSVWGTDIYTEDSALCRAAVHAGAIDPAKGGIVKFKGAPGCTKYKGTERNGVATGSWRSFGASFFFPGHGAGACAAGPADECPCTFTEIKVKDLPDKVACTCDAVAGGGSVWGSGIYTADSDFCRAALHAGAIKPGGGKAVARPALGCRKYIGSEKNGVTTGSWGAYPASWYFEDYGNGACPEVPVDECPDNFLGIPDPTATSFTCTCSQEAAAGSVWGTDIYTRDSSLCGAARHAGVGPKITVRSEKGCAKYKGSARNGIETGDWGAYDGSFVFDGHPGKCAE
jgi:hypothetical protein